MRPALLLLCAWACCVPVPREEARADAGPTVVLPRDEAPHSEQMEWWYYTGRLQSGAGEVYGFELTLFQPRIAGKYIAVAHLAVTDLQRRAYTHWMYIDAEDQRRAADQGFSLEAGPTWVKGQGGAHEIGGELEGYRLELSLAAQKPAVLQYGSGYMYVGSDDPFYYYSYTRMAAAGTLTVGAQRKQVSGPVWMDHQWGTIGNGYGWDWFSLRLDDLSEVMLFKVRKEAGDGFVGGTYIAADGQATELGPDDFTVTPTGSWESPHTGYTYSHGWQVSVPALQLDVAVDPVLADQEFATSFLGTPTYWEGLCDVRGTRAGARLRGHAYVEITGFVPVL